MEPSRALVTVTAIVAIMLTSDWTAHDDAPDARGGGPADFDRIRRRAADARCDRAVRCGSIRPEDQEACGRATDASLARELSDDGCPNGVIPEALVRCIDGLRSAPCEIISPDPAARCGAATLCSL